MMFERFRSPETKQKKQGLKGNAYKALDMLKLVKKEEVAEPPEPFLAIIDGKPWKFTYDDTHIARCVQKPELSSIVHLIKDESGEITGGASIYDQPDVMNDMQAQGFEVVDESLAEAEENYHLFHARGNEQASLN